MSQARSHVNKRGERRGEAVEKQPPGEAEREAQRAEDNVPLDSRTGRPMEPEEAGRLERPGTDAYEADDQ
jgi:hypothetical protein